MDTQKRELKTEAMTETQPQSLASPVMPEMPPEPGPARLIATLGLAGFFSGLLLVSSFVLTRPIIEQNKAEALQAAVYQVLEGCQSFEQLTWDGQALALGAATGENAAPVYIGYGEGGHVLGFAITSEEPGFQDIIKAIYGYDPEGDQIIGVDVRSIVPGRPKLIIGATGTKVKVLVKFIVTSNTVDIKNRLDVLAETNCFRVDWLYYYRSGILFASGN